MITLAGSASIGAGASATIALGPPPGRGRVVRGVLSAGFTSGAGPFRCRIYVSRSSAAAFSDPGSRMLHFGSVLLPAGATLPLLLLEEEVGLGQYVLVFAENLGTQGEYLSAVIFLEEG